MAETLVTLAFLSALAMLLSPLFDKGKWLASITAACCALSWALLPFDSIQQSGGSALVIITCMCGLIQYHIINGLAKKFLNGMGGCITLLILLAMYPEGGVVETVNDYSTLSNLQELFKSLIIGLLIAQLLANSLSFNNRISMFLVVTIITLQLGDGIFDGSVLSVVISTAMLVGFMPFIENKINKKIGTGQGRSVALGISTLIGIIFIFGLTFVSISGVERIGDGDGAVAVSLWMTSGVTLFGLLGMLLPLLGFDNHPRPEAWGWRIGLAVSPMLMTIQTDLASHVLLGVVLALLVSISSPLVLEKKSTKAI